MTRKVPTTTAEDAAGGLMVGRFLMSDDLLVLIDFCDVMATRIRGDWSDPRMECRAIWDAHDMAHALMGGDQLRSPWTHLYACLALSEDDPKVALDVFARVRDLRARMLT